MAGHVPAVRPPSGATPPSGLARSWRIFQAMRAEQADPVAAYSLLAADTAELLAAYHPLAGAVAVDVGGGPGYTAEALRAAGAAAFTLDPFPDELRLHGRTPVGAVVGDGLRLPLGDGTVDVVTTLNALEHVPTPWPFLEELLRACRPGGIVLVGLTNWLSPWGGHETSPWHYLGGERAARRYEARTGHPAKNRYGSSLFEVSVADVLRWADGCGSATVLDAFPRYYPRWCRPLVRIPGVREVATWNLALVMEKR